MNILIFSWRGPGHPNAGGAEISTHEHAKGWVKAGHSVTLLTSYFLGAKKEEVVDGISVLRKGSQFITVQWEAFKWYLYADHPKYDLVIDQFHGIPFFTPLYVRVKKIAFIHEVTKEVWKLNQCRFPYKYIIDVLGTTFEPLIFRLYRNIPFMTVSESTQKDLVQWGIPNRNITVIHNGISKIQFVSCPKEKKSTIIYLGALSKDKGTEEALRVFSILNKTADWQFWVVGKANPAYLKVLKVLSNKLQLGVQVKFWGFISEQKKFELLSRAHVLIHPSVREGWGLVVMEAAAVGTPTVAFNIPGLRDSIKDGETGILTKENTIQSLSSEIRKLLTDKKEYEKMQRDALNWSKEFSWEKSCRLSLALLTATMKDS